MRIYLCYQWKTKEPISRKKDEYSKLSNKLLLTENIIIINGNTAPIENGQYRNGICIHFWFYYLKFTSVLNDHNNNKKGNTAFVFLQKKKNW